MVVGLYVGYYAFYEIALQSGDVPRPDGVINVAARIQGACSGWVLRYGGWPWVAALALLLGGAGIAVGYRRVRRRI